MEKIYIIVIILLLIIVISIIYSHFKIDITNYEIKNKKIDKNLNILFLSDLHNRNMKNKLLKIIKNIKPDIIIFGGDMINDGFGENENFIDLYNKLKEYKSFYTFGNHENKLLIESKEIFNRELNNSNINVLNNKVEEVTNNIVLYGLNNDIDTYQKFGKKSLSEKYITDRLGKVNTHKYNILIAHNPLEFDSYIDYNADLVLSGHIHGGLFRIPFVKGILSPDVTFFPKYDAGLYYKSNTQMIVSRGLGYSKRIPFRVFNPAEVVVIKLKSDL